MNTTIDLAVPIIKEETASILFSICTLVTRKEEYEEMLESYINKGFTTDCCEFLYIDNSENCTYDAYEGLNIFLQRVKGSYVILCHQDIIIHQNDINHLLNLINEVSQKDPKWGVLGNAGGVNLKWRTNHITNGDGTEIKEKHLPLRVKTLDENFMVVKKSANLALSSNLTGFHLYGTDICLIADILGYSSYVIGFNLIHKSNGTVDERFFNSKHNLIKKYQNAFRSRYMSSTITRFYLTGNPIALYFFNTGIVLFLARQFYKITTSKKNYKL